MLTSIRTFLQAVELPLSSQPPESARGTTDGPTVNEAPSHNDNSQPTSTQPSFDKTSYGIIAPRDSGAPETLLSIPNEANIMPLSSSTAEAQPSVTAVCNAAAHIGESRSMPHSLAHQACQMSHAHDAASKPAGLQCTAAAPAHPLPPAWTVHYSQLPEPDLPPVAAVPPWRVHLSPELAQPQLTHRQACQFSKPAWQLQHSTPGEAAVRGGERAPMGPWTVQSLHTPPVMGHKAGAAPLLASWKVHMPASDPQAASPLPAAQRSHASAGFREPETRGNGPLSVCETRHEFNGCMPEDGMDISPVRHNAGCTSMASEHWPAAGAAYNFNGEFPASTPQRGMRRRTDVPQRTGDAGMISENVGMDISPLPAQARRLPGALPAAELAAAMFATRSAASLSPMPRKNGPSGFGAPTWLQTGMGQVAEPACSDRRHLGSRQPMPSAASIPPGGQRFDSEFLKTEEALFASGESKCYGAEQHLRGPAAAYGRPLAGLQDGTRAGFGDSPKPDIDADDKFEMSQTVCRLVAALKGGAGGASASSPAGAPTDKQQQWPVQQRAAEIIPEYIKPLSQAEPGTGCCCHAPQAVASSTGAHRALVPAAQQRHPWDVSSSQPADETSEAEESDMSMSQGVLNLISRLNQGPGTDEALSTPGPSTHQTASKVSAAAAFACHSSCYEGLTTSGCSDNSRSDQHPRCPGQAAYNPPTPDTAATDADNVVSCCSGSLQNQLATSSSAQESSWKHVGASSSALASRLLQLKHQHEKAPTVMPPNNSIGAKQSQVPDLGSESLASNSSDGSRGAGNSPASANAGPDRPAVYGMGGAVARASSQNEVAVPAPMQLECSSSASHPFNTAATAGGGTPAGAGFVPTAFGRDCCEPFMCEDGQTLIIAETQEPSDMDDVYNIGGQPPCNATACNDGVSMYTDNAAKGGANGGSPAILPATIHKVQPSNASVGPSIEAPRIEDRPIVARAMVRPTEAAAAAVPALSGVSAVVSSELSAQDAEAVRTAFREHGGTLVPRFHLGSGANTVVCSPHQAAQWLPSGLNLVSPDWVIRYPKQPQLRQ